MVNSMNAKKYFISLFLLCSFWGVCYGFQGNDTLCCRIYFPVNRSTLDLSYRNNGPRLDSLLCVIRSLRENAELRRISLCSSSSPEGNTSLNRILSDQRGAALRFYIQEHLFLPDSMFVLSSLGQNWEGLYSLVEKSDMPYREEVLHILRRIIYERTDSDFYKRQLMDLCGGRAWYYMQELFFPELRNSSVIECKFAPIIMKDISTGESVERQKADTVIVRDTIGMVIILRDTVSVPSVSASNTSRPFCMALKTNLLYDVILVPNIGLEFYLGKGWSVGGNWMYAWWDNDRRHRYWRVYGGEVDIRKYLGRSVACKPLTGHHIGFYGQVLTYDFEMGGHGYIGGRPGGSLWEKANYGVGIEYGYSLPVGKRLNLDFSLGLGYLGGTYYEYLPVGEHYVWKETRQRHWFGPTKGEISLVWFLGRGNNCDRKGGIK